MPNNKYQMQAFHNNTTGEWYEKQVFKLPYVLIIQCKGNIFFYITSI